MLKRKIINILFFTVFILISFAGFLKPFMDPKDINYAENRMAYQIPSFTMSSFLDKTFQDQYENALADQIPLSSEMKRIEKTIELLAKFTFFKLNPNTFHNIGGLLYKDEYFVYFPREFSNVQEQLDRKIQNLNEVKEKLPNVDISLYYIEKDTDIHFETGEKLGAYEYIADKVNQQFHTKKFAINNFDEFKQYFYKTDHHWNAQGSYKAYQEIVEWMGLGEPIVPKEEVCLQATMSGSKVAGIGGNFLFQEQLCAYPFDFKEHDIYVNGQKVESYGNYRQYFENKVTEGSYADFYGDDYGLLSFDYHQDEKENLLIIGESYDNAINELLASHFNRTYNIDLRNYEREMGKAFDLYAFVEEHQIDRILLIGNIDYYVMEEFDLKGGN